MDMIHKNKAIFDTLKQNYPELNDFTVEENFLIFNNQKIDISKFDLEVLIDDSFISTIKGKSTEEIFKLLQTRISSQETMTNEDKLNTIIMENPLMKNITIFTNEDLNTHLKSEFINIRTSDGENYLFKNESNFDLFEFYYGLERIYGDAITPDIMANEINKWHLNKLEIQDSNELLANDAISESFKAKLNKITEQYKGQSGISIEANALNEIVYVNNEFEPEKSIIVTFDYNINNEIVTVTHTNNVKQEKENKEKTDATDIEQLDEPIAETVINTVNNSVLGGEDMVYNNTGKTIGMQELYTIIKQDGPYSLEERDKVDAFFNDLSGMIKANNPRGEEILNEFSEYIKMLQIEKETYTERESDFMARNYQLYDELEKSKGNSKGNQITLKKEGVIVPQTESDNDSYGFSSPEAIIILITAIVVVLSITVLALF